MESLKRDLTSCKISASTVILDIEGTTTSISFVKDILFPYIRNNLEQFLNENWGSDELQEHIKALRIQAQQDEENKVEGIIPIPEEGEDDTLKSALLDNIKWQMDNDRKTKSLKDLQGLIMEKGYKAGDLKGHVYEDVEPSLKLWSEQEKSIYIYSSGSVQAQKLLFGNSDKGDILPFIKGHFDTNVGMKGDASSYKEILKQISRSPSETVFFTDVPSEARAAKEAGIISILVSREGNVLLSNENKSEFKVITSFEDVEFEINCKKMKICPENLVTVSNKEIENCSFSIKDHEKPDPQNCIESEENCNNKKSCDAFSNSDELMDINNSSIEKTSNSDVNTIIKSDNIKQEESSTESKKEELPETLKDESMESKNEEPTRTENMEEESTQNMEEGESEGKNEDSTQGINEITEIKKIESNESTKKDTSYEHKTEESDEIKKEESTQYIKEGGIESKNENSAQGIKDITEIKKIESNESMKKDSYEHKKEESVDIKKDLTETLKSESTESVEEELIESMKEKPVDIKEVTAEERKTEEPNENLEQNLNENMEEETGKSMKQESIQNKVELSDEDKRDTRVSFVDISRGLTKSSSTEDIKEETSGRKMIKMVHIEMIQQNLEVEGATKCINVIENVSSVGIENKNEDNSVSASKPNNLNENPAVSVHEHNSVENGEGLKTLIVESQDNSTINESKISSNNSDDSSGLSNYEGGAEFKNKDNQVSHVDTAFDLVEDKKHDENAVDANNDFKSDNCEIKQSEETVFKKTVMEELQKGDCVTANGLEEKEKSNDYDACSGVENKSSSETSNENLKSISPNGQIENDESKATNGFSTPDLIKDNGCTEEVSLESKKCENSESKSLESVVEA